VTALRGSALCTALVVLLLADSGRAEWVDWVLDADLAARFDSDVNRASVSSERATSTGASSTLTPAMPAVSTC